MSPDRSYPFLSIVLPTYNVEKYIDRCINSCLNQTFRSIEIIVVDDCGQDSSIQKAEQRALQDTRIRIIRNNRNMGTYHARRIGTEAANGAYVLFLDPDDELAADAAELIHAASTDNMFDIIFFGVQQVPETRSLFKKHSLPRHTSFDVPAERTILGTRNLFYGTAGKAYLTSKIKIAFSSLKVDQNLRLVYAEDFLVLWAMLIHTTSFFSIHKNLYYYHRNSDSITIKARKDSVAFKCIQINKIVDIIRNHSSNTIPPIKINYCSNEILQIILSQKFLLSRHEIDHNGKSIYFSNVLKSFNLRFSVADVIRLVIYMISCTLVKL